MRTFLKSSVCLLVLAGLAHAEEGKPKTVRFALYDTGKTVDLGDQAASLPMEGADWKLLDAKATKGQAIQGDAVLMNKKLAAIIHIDGHVELYAKGIGGWNRRGKVAPLKGNTVSKFTGLKVSAEEVTGIAIDAQLDGDPGDSVTFSVDQPGFPALKATPKGNVESLRFFAPCRLGILPDFYADDLMLDARKIPVDRVEIPSSHLYLHLTGKGEAIVAAVWEQGGDDLKLTLSGDGENRMFTATDIPFSKGPIWATVMEQKNIWYSTELKPDAIKRKFQFDWKVPFLAKWKGNFTRADGTIKSRQFKYRKDWYDGRVDGLAKKGDHFVAGIFWGEATKKKKRSKKGKKPEPEVVEAPKPNILMAGYPISREKNTPLKHLCIDDLLRLLNTEKCAYVLDLGGRKGDSGPGLEKGIFTCNHDVMTSTITPKGSPRNNRALAEFVKDERVYFRTIDEQVLVFIKNIEDRINSYIGFRKDLLAYLAEQEAKNPSPKVVEFITRLKKKITEPVRVFSRTEKALQLADGVKRSQPTLERRRKALRIDTPENAGASRIALRWIGDPQDCRVQCERMNAIRLRAMASMEGAINPDAKEIAKEIGKRTKAILRNAPAHEKPIKY